MGSDGICGYFLPEMKYNMLTITKTKMIKKRVLFINALYFGRLSKGCLDVQRQAPTW
jgi:hypothetical protein